MCLSLLCIQLSIKIAHLVIGIDSYWFMSCSNYYGLIYDFCGLYIRLFQFGIFCLLLVTVIKFSLYVLV